MIAHFRRHQRAIYLVITVVIVISFSFFGTYSSLTKGSFSGDTQIATLVDGKKVYDSEYQRYARFFLQNPLNGSFMEELFIPTSFCDALVESIAPEIQESYFAQYEKEKKFAPYYHPKAPFIGLENIWTYFAPDIKASFAQYHELPVDVAFIDLYRAKKSLYLSEQKFPANYAKQVLLYQQKQYSWLEPDVTLESRNLQLFGYTSFEDWFGKRFMTASLLSLMNIRQIAEKEGLTVSYNDAKIQLYANAKKYIERSFRGDAQDNEEKQRQIESLIQKSLASFGLEEHEAIEMVRTTLLFRRALLEIPSHIITPTTPFEPFLKDAYQKATCFVYTLPRTLHVKTVRDIVERQFWFDAVSPKSARGKDGLDLPKEFYTVEEVMKHAPELVQKRFLLSYSKIRMEDLYEKIRLKDMLLWLQGDDHWEALTKEFPTLLEKPTERAVDRVRIFESLSGSMKKEVDSSIRKAIIMSKPEWIQKALTGQQPVVEVVSLRPVGGKMPFDGITDREELLSHLSKAPIGEVSQALQKYSQDGQYYYSFTVLDRSSDYEILPLGEAVEDGTLNVLLSQFLKKRYLHLQNDKIGDSKKKVEEFKKENGQWRDFHEVEDQCILYVYGDLLQQLDLQIQEWKNRLPEYTDWAPSASGKNVTLYPQVRFLAYFAKLQEEAMKNGGQVEPAILSDVAASEEALHALPNNFVSTASSLNKGWQLEKLKKSFLKKDVVAQKQQALEQLFTSTNSSSVPIYFDEEQSTPASSWLLSKEEADISTVLFESAQIIAQFLGEEAMKERSQLLLKYMVEKNALTATLERVE